MGLWRASRLSLVTDFADLLPQDQPSVIELRRILARTRGLSNVFIVIEGQDPLRLRTFADQLLPALRAIGSPYVESARDGAQDARRFLQPRAGFYLSESDLATVEKSVFEAERAAFRRRIGADLDDDAPVAAVGTKIAASQRPADGRELVRPLLDKLGALDRFPEGYFQARTPTGFAQVVIVKAAIATGDIAGGTATIQRVRAVVAATLAASPGAPVHLGYAGDLLTSMAEYDQVRSDVQHVGGLGLILVLGVVLVFFRTPRALVALGVAIGVGCAATFGVTELTLGHLNVATAFLLSIVAGNGVNFGIIWLARFIEERRAGRSLVRAVELALTQTYGATLTAASAAATAYAALGIGRFRGFRHFAFIGGTGMLLCWLTSYTLLPAVAVLLERRRMRAPATSGGHRQRPPSFTRFERPFVPVVARAPGLTLALALGLGGVALVMAVRYLSRGALEYDMRHLQSDRARNGALYEASDLAHRVLGNSGVGGMVVLVDDARDAPVLARILRQTRDGFPAALRPFQDVQSLGDLVPPAQTERLARLQVLFKHLVHAHDRGAIDDGAWGRIAPMLPPPDFRPFTADDLPAELTEPFTEKDGTRGRVVYVEETVGQSDSDLHYLLRLADAFRRTRLPDGRVVHGSGRAVIFADLLEASLVDMPRSVVLSLALTAAAVVLLFRRARPVAMVLGSLLLALTWMLGAMAALDVRLSFINFIALPVTFGIGVDYGVNLYGRFEKEPHAGILGAMRGAGGPVILCSLTTSLGYVALLRSHNQAVRSLGAVAVLGEVSCLLAALMALTAAVAWRGRRRATVTTAGISA